jgi:hypothetical protein
VIAVGGNPMGRMIRAMLWMKVKSGREAEFEQA